MTLKGMPLAWFFTSLPPLNIIARASGFDIDTVSGSSRKRASQPHSFTAAICRAIAWSVTLMALTAILSPSRRSRSVLMRGSTDSSITVEAHSGTTPRTFCAPRVLSHITKAGP